MILPYYNFNSLPGSTLHELPGKVGLHIPKHVISVPRLCLICTFVVGSLEFVMTREGRSTPTSWTLSIHWDQSLGSFRTGNALLFNQVINVTAGADSFLIFLHPNTFWKAWKMLSIIFHKFSIVSLWKSSHPYFLRRQSDKLDQQGRMELLYDRITVELIVVPFFSGLISERSIDRLLMWGPLEDSIMTTGAAGDLGFWEFERIDCINLRFARDPLPFLRRLHFGSILECALAARCEKPVWKWQ